MNEQPIHEWDKDTTPPCEQDSETAKNAVADTVNSTEVPSDTGEDMPNDGAQSTQLPAKDAEYEQKAEAVPPSPSEPIENTPEVRSWQFGGAGGTVAVKEHSTRRFYLLFSAIFGVVILLLALTLTLGGNAFQILRTIHTERTVFVREYDSESGLLTPQEAADMVRKSTVTVVVKGDNSSGHGSGFIYTDNGYIITNHHVIESANRTVQVILADGRVFDAAIVGSNAAADVAVLKIDATDLPAATLGSSADLLTGDDVVAVGTPAKIDYAGTATFGKISYPARMVPLTNVSGSVEKKMMLIQTDTDVNSGNSGGPLADMYGHVIGVVVMKLTANGTTVYEGIGFALPIDGVKTIADAIIKDGVFRGQNPIAEERSLIGVTGHGGEAGYWYSDTPDPETGSMLRSDTAEEGYHYMEKDGVYVTEINGGNAIGKMHEGDIILRADGLYVLDVTELISAVNRHHIGETVKLTVWRNGALIDIDIVLYGG